MAATIVHHVETMVVVVEVEVEVVSMTAAVKNASSIKAYIVDKGTSTLLKAELIPGSIECPTHQS